jgi:DNA-binding NarL/FixJ family response regulator
MLASHTASFASESPLPVFKAERRFNVLLVEDDPVFLSQMRSALSELDSDWQVFACQNAQQAMDIIESPDSQIDLALVDLGLPDLDGTEVIRQIRTRYQDAHIMVISVIAAEQRVLSAIRAGAQGYILKEEQPDTITSAIGQVMQGNYPISPALARCLFKLAGAPGDAPDSQASIKLSPKETLLLQLISQGLSYVDAAQKMGVATSTVQSHIRNLYRKLDAHSQVQAVNKAREHGLL